MDFISSPAGGPRGALGLCGFLPAPVRDAGTAGTAHTHDLRSPLLSSCCFSGCGRPYVALCSSSFAPRALRSSQLVRQRRFTTPVAVATSWRRSQMKNKFPASVSYMLSLNQIQRKRESHEHQSVVLATPGVDATWGESPGQEAGLVKWGASFSLRKAGCPGSPAQSRGALRTPFPAFL